ncbi:unnamed protein product [Sphagnum jensenii]|uniref:Uncharacterized protein n=1 Tax=Sphagnum jensenii TaxID=128206 RepID=A0ABP0V9R1_9BRYO
MIAALKPSSPGAFLVSKDKITDESSVAVKWGSSVESSRADFERTRSECCDSVSVEGSSSGKYWVRR